MAPGLVGGRATPAQHCASAKERAVGNTTVCRTRCDASALKKGTPTESACLAACGSRFGRKWTKIEAGGGCATTGDQSSLESKVEALRAILSAFAAPPPSSCAATKLREGGKKAACRLSCLAKAKRQGGVVDAACLARCTSKFSERCVDADDLGDCPGTANCLLIEGVVDTFVADVDAALPAETSTTTTTVPTDCGLDEPACDGSCPAGQHCDATGLLSCACFPDGVTGCGTSTFPQCGGACPAGSQCQAVAVDGDFTFRECECVPSNSDCRTSQCSSPGVCPPGLLCGFFVVGSSPECGCFPATTTSVSTTSTTTTTSPRPCGDLQFPQCNGTCPPGEHCGSAGDLAFSCACFPDGVTGCGDAAYPQCGGACGDGKVCQGQHVQTGSGVMTGCLCASGACSIPGTFMCNSFPGVCDTPGQVCIAFVFGGGGGAECGCGAP